VTSRQTLWNRRNDVARLQTCAPAPLVVSHDGRNYIVTRPGSSEALYRGRYEVIYAWLAGYCRAKLDAPPAAVDTDPNVT